MPRKSTPPRDLITTAEAGAILGVDPSQVRRYVKARMLTGIHVNDRLTLLSRAEVQRFERPPIGRPKSES